MGEWIVPTLSAKTAETMGHPQIQKPLRARPKRAPPACVRYRYRGQPVGIVIRIRGGLAVCVSDRRPATTRSQENVVVLKSGVMVVGGDAHSRLWAFRHATTVSRESE